MAEAESPIGIGLLVIDVIVVQPVDIRHIETMATRRVDLRELKFESVWFIRLPIT